MTATKLLRSLAAAPSSSATNLFRKVDDASAWRKSASSAILTRMLRRKSTAWLRRRASSSSSSPPPPRSFALFMADWSELEVSSSKGSTVRSRAPTGVLRTLAAAVREAKKDGESLTTCGGEKENGMVTLCIEETYTQ